MAEADPTPIYVTVGFKCADKAAFDEFWKHIRETYRFCEDAGDAETQAFAVSMANMFEEQDVVDAILSSDMDYSEQVEMIGEIACNPDLRGLCAKWDIAHPYDVASPAEAA